MKISFFGLLFYTLAMMDCHSAGIIAGPVLNPSNGNAYYLLERSSWKEAEAEAVSLGGHLVTIDDAAENQWVLNTFSPLASGDRHLWIGLNDEESEGDFVWVSGEAFDYQNWSPGEPNDLNSEDFAHIVGNPFDTHLSGSWNDIRESGIGGGGGVTIPHGVVEVPASVLGGTPVELDIRTAVDIGWQSENDALYQVQFTEDVESGIWHDIGQPVEGNGALKYFLDTTRFTSRRFYRVLRLP